MGKNARAGETARCHLDKGGGSIRCVNGGACPLACGRRPSRPATVTETVDSHREERDRVGVLHVLRRNEVTSSRSAGNSTHRCALPISSPSSVTVRFGVNRNRSLTVADQSPYQEGVVNEKRPNRAVKSLGSREL
jgi:hypothetical protein